MGDCQHEYEPTEFLLEKATPMDGGKTIKIARIEMCKNCRGLRLSDDVFRRPSPDRKGA